MQHYKKYGLAYSFFNDHLWVKLRLDKNFQMVRIIMISSTFLCKFQEYFDLPF